MSLKDTYNRLAEDWCEDHRVDTWWIEGVDAFASLLKSESLVLDLGCGGGDKSNYLIQKGLSVVGIDFSEKMIEIAKRTAPLGTFHVMNLKDVSRLPGLFDGILAQAVLLHVSKAEMAAVMDGLRSKLKDGGFLAVAVKEARSGQQEEEMKVENDYGYPYERFFSYFTLPEVRKVFTDAGMSVYSESITHVGHTRWIQVIGQKA
ncbi:MAG: class I SAM-dependent methyltransferase [Patescibacteria group bacterium]